MTEEVIENEKSPKPPATMAEKEAYFDQLELWVKHSNASHFAMASFPYYVMANPQLFPFGIFPITSQTNEQQLEEQQLNQTILQRINMMNRNRFRQDNSIENQIRNNQIINQNGGYEYVIAPIWKRFAAEAIDVCILFILKLLIVFMIIDIFEIDFGFDFEALRNSIEEDYTEFITISSEMIYIEIITKIFVCFYEAFWTRQGHGIHIGGATPGKIFMGIRILYVEAVMPIDHQQPQPGNLYYLTQTSLRALIYPARNPGFKRAFGRALAKNLLMALLFPLCFVVLFFRNNRTSYDLLTNTIVVEENPQPVLRRP